MQIKDMTMACCLTFSVLGVVKGDSLWAQKPVGIQLASSSPKKHWYEDRYLFSNQYLDLGGILLISSSSKTVVYPRFYYQSNHFSYEMWGGMFGTGMIVGLNYFLPFAGFSPEVRFDNVYFKTELGLQSFLYWGVGFLPYGVVAGGSIHPIFKKFALNTEIGIKRRLSVYSRWPLFPYINLGLVYYKNGRD